MEDLVNNTSDSATEDASKSEGTVPKKRKRIVLYNYVKSTWTIDMVYAAIALLVSYLMMALTIFLVNLTVPNVPGKISFITMASIFCGIYSFVVCARKMYSDRRFNKINFIILFFAMINLISWAYMLR
jgi:hypothetical protein